MAVIWPSQSSQYPLDYDLPIVDHIHALRHGIHWPLISSHKLGAETFHPDVDIRDYDTGYAIDVELPGLSDKRSIKVEWTSKHDITMSGSLTRPDVPTSTKHPDNNGHDTLSAGNPKGDIEKNELTPTLLVSERKTGHFCRKFHLPMEVDAANLRAKLENGLLKIRVEKVVLDQRISGQAQIE
jgi:HSP20 family molecular chaperone IbpA